MSQPPVSRRRLLLLVGAGIVAAGVPVLSRAFGPGPEDAPALAEELLAVLDDREGARLVGRLWLAGGGAGAPTATALAAAVSGRLRDHGWQPGAGPGPLRSALAAGIRSDYEHDDMVSIEGWQLARTAAELCALAAL